MVHASLSAGLAFDRLVSEFATVTIRIPGCCTQTYQTPVIWEQPDSTHCLSWEIWAMPLAYRTTPMHVSVFAPLTPCFSSLFFSFMSTPPLLSAQSINLQWSGCLTAAPPEEYQSMLLWRQDQSPLVYFPPLVLHVTVPKLNMIQTLSVKGSLSLMCRYETVI